MKKELIRKDELETRNSHIAVLAMDRMEQSLYLLERLDVKNLSNSDITEYNIEMASISCAIKNLNALLESGDGIVTDAEASFICSAGNSSANTLSSMRELVMSADRHPPI